MSRRRKSQLLAAALVIAAALGVRNQLLSQDDPSAPPEEKPSNIFTYRDITIIGPDGQKMVIPQINHSQLGPGQIQSVAREKRPFLGVATQELQKGVQQHLGLVPNSGLLVTKVVEGNPAAAAGIQEHDILIELEGKPLFKTSDLVTRLRANQGEPVKLLVLRAGQRMEVAITPVISEQPVWPAEFENFPSMPQIPSPPSLDDLRLIYPGVRIPGSDAQMQQIRKEMDEIRAQQAEMLKQMQEMLRSR